ncbi:head-tail adaptor protein [Sphingomonas olei]|uniref:Head-tail adaptor protein n=1 Tax=Sphingomonas olei TaxID=1886787 RepID=A0ABY2QIZ5_9SPHN|nr:head-tail adaptor protein [Sphingomonas olei]THG40438.1 head-tail adaptor protein [Sphingomonas olei]
MIVVRPSELDHEVRLERPSADEGFDGAGVGEWVLVDTIWIGLRDQLPSRSEKADSGITTATRRARVRMYWRDDVTPDMRLVLGTRIMQIVSGPAELGRRGGLELMVEDYSPAGNPA